MAPALFASVALFIGGACTDDVGGTDSGSEETTAAETGDGDGDPSTGDGDGDDQTGDGDGDATSGDGDGEPGPDPACGDGIVDEGEACDDGNDIDTDACTNACELAVCGDGIVHEGVEACDDGNDDNSDTCVEGCVEASCGDGYVGPGEGCDDGNDIPDDACDNSCTPASCGDGVVQMGEACDDGNEDNTDDCLDTCAPASCGDGYVWTDNETCDDANADDTDACLTTCEAASCGDGHVWVDNEGCDDGNDDDSDACPTSCEPASCGDGFVWSDNEFCDDANNQGQDGCENDCSPSEGARKVEVGPTHTCVPFWDGGVKCWGANGDNNIDGRLGYPGVDQIGDNETPDSFDYVDVGGIAVDISVGYSHTCVVLDDGAVTCWGTGGPRSGRPWPFSGNYGDNEAPASAPLIDVGDVAVEIVAGWSHTCVLTDQQTLRCWGENLSGELGIGSTDSIGYDQHPSEIDPVELGNNVIGIAAGGYSTCALLESNELRCWGSNGSGQLGIGSYQAIGDDELPLDIDPISFPGLDDETITDVAMGTSHACARFEDSTVRCWGNGNSGQLGNWNDESTEIPIFTVNEEFEAITLGSAHTCGQTGDQLWCWGEGGYGAHGLGTWGDRTKPYLVSVGFSVTSMMAPSTGDHTCVLAGPELRCWGRNHRGQLGYGHTDTIGIDEVPSQVGVVPYY